MAYFFDASQGAHEQITALYDFVWPTAVAMWNLRWQVASYVQLVPNASVKTLRGRFAAGSEIDGANLKRSCIERTWEQQQEEFAQVLLINTVAVYEGWVADVLSNLVAYNSENSKGLQFPVSLSRPSSPSVTSVIATLTTNESIALKSAFYSTLQNNRRYDIGHLDNQLRCYRYFKELRNARMHAGGTAVDRTLNAYNDFAIVATNTDLGVDEVPEHAAITIGAKPELSLRGVVGFSGLVLQMITTIDAELSRSVSAEDYFVKRWKNSYRGRAGLSNARQKRVRRLKVLLKKAGFPEPDNIDALAELMKTKWLIWF